MNSRIVVAALFAVSLLACDTGSVDVANLDSPGGGGPAIGDPAAAEPTAANAPQAVTSWTPDRAGAIIDLGGGWYQTNNETFRAYTEGQGPEGYLDFVWDGRTPNDSGLPIEDVTIRLGPNDMNELNIGLWFTKSAWFNEGRLVVQQKYNPEDLGLSWLQAPPDGVWSQGYTYLGGTPVQIQQGRQYQLGYRINSNQLDVLLDGQSIWTCTIPPDSMQYMIGTDTNIRSDNAMIRFSYRMGVPQQATVAQSP